MLINSLVMYRETLICILNIFARKRAGISRYSEARQMLNAVHAFAFYCIISRQNCFSVSS